MLILPLRSPCHSADTLRLLPRPITSANFFRLRYILLLRLLFLLSFSLLIFFFLIFCCSHHCLYFFTCLTDGLMRK